MVRDKAAVLSDTNVRFYLNMIYTTEIINLEHIPGYFNSSVYIVLHNLHRICGYSLVFLMNIKQTILLFTSDYKYPCYWLIDYHPAKYND